jgi:hypothetical protein
VSDFTRSLLQERRSRTVAAVMGSLEKSAAWPRLSRDEKSDTRDVVFASINGYHELVLDLVKVFSDGQVMINEQAVQMIKDLHDDLALG